MAEFEMKCPHCGTELEVQDEWANMETACPACSKTFIIPARPKVRPELKLRPQAGSVMANNFGNGQQTTPYYGPQTGGGSAPLAVCPSWREQTAAPPVNPFLRPFVNCLTTKGRASRLEYNLFMFISFPVLVFAFLLVVIRPIMSFYAGVSDLNILIAILYLFGFLDIAYICQKIS